MIKAKTDYLHIATRTLSVQMDNIKLRVTLEIFIEHPAYLSEQSS